MAKFHVNSRGDAGQCSAAEGNCPFGPDEPHYGSKEEARAGFEAGMESQGWVKVSKKQPGVDLAIPASSEVAIVQPPRLSSALKADLGSLLFKTGLVVAEMKRRNSVGTGVFWGDYNMGQFQGVAESLNTVLRADNADDKELNTAVARFEEMQYGVKYLSRSSGFLTSTMLKPDVQAVVPDVSKTFLHLREGVLDAALSHPGCGPKTIETIASGDQDSFDMVDKAGKVDAPLMNNLARRSVDEVRLNSMDFGDHNWDVLRNSALQNRSHALTCAIADPDVMQRAEFLNHIQSTSMADLTVSDLTFLTKNLYRIPNRNDRQLLATAIQDYTTSYYSPEENAIVNNAKQKLNNEDQALFNSRLGDKPVEAKRSVRERIFG